MRNRPEKMIIDKGERVRVRTINTEETRTQQQFKDQCDVNNIIAKYKQTGSWPGDPNKKGVYADISGITDYQQSLQKVLDAQAAFQGLSSDLRTRFQNDPAQLLAFLQDPSNYDEGVKLGLFTPKHNDANEPQLNQNESNETKQPGSKNAPIKKQKTDPTPEN